MPHVAPLSIDDAPPKSQPILKAIEEKFGQSLNIFSTMAHQPDVLGGVTQVNDGMQNDLPGRFRELAYYLASTINGCEYCGHYHKGAAKKEGVSDETLAAITDYATSDHFDKQDRAVLKYAEELTREANVSGDTVAAVKEFLNDTQLVTLAAAVSLANFTNRFNHGLDIQLP